VTLPVAKYEPAVAGVEGSVNIFESPYVVFKDASSASIWKVESACE
jgi:hypothetical protein